jgi:pyruvate, water dikinase
VDDLYWLDLIQPQHRDWVGDKAFYLALLKQRGYPVAPGFVISASRLQSFLTEVDWQEQLFADLPLSSIYLDADNSRQLQRVAREIQRAFSGSEISSTLLAHLEAAIQSWQAECLILRPSLGLLSGLDPTVSARTNGLLTSRIWRQGQPLAELLKAVWAELFSAKSLFYWQRYGVQLQQVRLAVLVQPIQSSLAAGMVQIGSGQVQVQATWGLGQTLALGGSDQFWGDLHQGTWSEQIGQKLYAYRLASPEATSADNSESLALQSVLTAWIPEPDLGLQLELVEPQQQIQPTLSLAQLQMLSEMAQQIETVIGLPLRLEWALEANQLGLHITQAIPRFDALVSEAEESGLAGLVLDPDPKHQPSHLPVSSHRLAAIPTPAIPSPAASVDSPQTLSGLAAAPGRIVAPAWVLELGVSVTIPSGVILVASVVTPQMVQLHQAAGIVTEQGGMTSHAAILARELGIPAVVGVERATQVIRTGDALALDGDLGQIYCGAELPPWTEQDASTDWANPALQAQPTQMPLSSAPPDLQNQASRTPQVWVSLSQLSTLSQVASLPVEGLGLLRSELMLLDLFGQQHPVAWLRQSPEAVIAAQIAARILPFAAAFAPRPVFYRAMDLPPQEFHPQLYSQFTSPASPEGTEFFSSAPSASMLGVRGSFSFQLYPDLLQVQLLALQQLQQQGLTNLSLVLPFVRTVEEFCFCRQQVERAGLFELPQFRLWIMAEVPSVLLLLPDYVAAGVQGIAIGMNDLTQLLLGVDRDHPQMATAFDPTHPAVLRAVEQLIQTAARLDLPCSVCGQGFQQRSQLLAQLREWGVTAVSVEPREVDWVRRVWGDEGVSLP